jgi:ubiquinone/menaquinone biosynthesis C-methylase UbiE
VEENAAPQKDRGNLMSSDWREVAEAYDSISKQYDNWAWQHFWRKNEFPLIEMAFKLDGPVDASLDIGIGTGAYSALHQSYSRRFVGIDLSVGMLDVFLQHHSKGQGVCAQAAALPFRNGSFRRVLITRVLSHVPSVEQVLSETRRVLRPGGSVVISDLDPEHDYKFITFRDGNAVGDDTTLVPHKHSIDEITVLASAVGLGLERSWRFRFSELKWKPNNESLPSLDRSSSRHIFYVAVYRDLRKRND